MRDPADEHAWTDGRGTLTVASPGRGVVVTKVSGFATVELAKKLVASVDLQIARGALPTIFHDWEDVAGYAPSVRKQLADWYVRVRRDVRGVHVFTRSKLVAMGVSLVTLATGQEITAHSDRTAFEAALADELRIRGG